MRLFFNKKFCFIILFTALILPLNLIKAQNPFEGKLRFRIQDETGKVSFITYSIHKDNMRVDMMTSVMGGKFYMIIKGKTMYMVMPDQKMYIEYGGGFEKLANLKSPYDIPAPSKPDTDNGLSFKEVFNKAKTGDTKTILGYKCTEFVLPNSNGGAMHIWANKNFKNIVMMQNQTSSNPILSMAKNMGGFFPLLTEEKDANGKIISKFELVEMSKKKLDKNLFTIPANYKKMVIPGTK